ncbi:MAG: hypothetical protein ACTHU0_35600 [Kofleriaceae bacterium]
MNRVRKFFTLVFPSMLAGGLLFGSAFGHASAGPDASMGFWPAPSDGSGGGASGSDRAHRARAPRTAQAPHPTPRPAPRPVPPAPPAPPEPPSPPHGAKRGVSFMFHDGKLRVDGIDDFARQQIDAVRQMMRSNPNIPPAVRAKVLARLDKARAGIDRRLRNLSVSDLDQFGDEMDKMGDEIEKAMEGLEEEMEQLGEQLGKDFTKKFAKDFAKNFSPGQFKFDFHSDSDDSDPGHSNDGSSSDDDDDDHDSSAALSTDVDIDVDADLSDAVRDLKGMSLKPAQRDQLVKIRTTSERSVASAKKQLDDASHRLEVALGDLNTSMTDIERYVDQISSHEAAIRKARLLAWVQARRVLDDGQRQKIEAAAAKKKHR